MLNCTKTKLANCALCKGAPPRVSGCYLFVILCRIIYYTEDRRPSRAPEGIYIVLFRYARGIYYIQADIYLYNTRDIEDIDKEGERRYTNYTGRSRAREGWR